MSLSQPIKDCPFCADNNLIEGTILAQSESAYLLLSKFSPNNFLVIPNNHVESPLNLSDTWWYEVKALLRQIPNMPEHYNISLNMGDVAGQTVKHLHFWIIPRKADSPSSCKGLVGLLKVVDSMS